MKSANYSFMMTPDKRNACTALPSFSHVCYFDLNSVQIIVFLLVSALTSALPTRSLYRFTLLGNMFVSVIEPCILLFDGSQT